MTPFLKQVAQKYFNPSESTDHNCYIFANRRSLLFFRKYYSEQVKNLHKTVFCPQMLTIADFIYKASGEVPADKIDLLLCLYDCYKELISPCESLDEFLFWGEMILSDFGDVDKYLIDARKIFTNVSDFKKIQGNPGDYLDSEQIKALEAFVTCLQVGRDGKYKESFRKTWEILLPLYTSFREALEKQGKAYDGMVYRRMAELAREEGMEGTLKKKFPETAQFVFVGLNAPTDSELAILRAMKKEGLAKFCWDYSSEWIKDPDNKSSFFLREHIRQFGQDMELDPEGVGKPEINVLSVPSSIGQCKQLGSIFRRTCTDENGRPYVPGIETAIVLPEENLLIPTLNALPEEIEKINVTMGYPMSGSLISALIDNICSMQMHMRTSSDGAVSFYHKQVYDIFANPLVKGTIDERQERIIESVKSEHKHYIPQADLAEKEEGLLSTIFTPAISAAADANASQIRELCGYLKRVIETIALLIKGTEDNSIELDFAKEYYSAIERLENFNLEIIPATFFHLLSNLVRRSTVPFKGEPLQGLQIMGPLETRALDFENVIILSCNDGIFPRHNSSESFIPAELRRGFGLPSHEYQDALWAYYFYRLIQRAKKVWMVLSTSNDQKIGSVEESRYIKQLELGFGARINRFVATSVIKAGQNYPDIKKSPEHIAKLTADGKFLSASALKDYLNCQAKFYYSHIEGLRKPDEVKENLDSGMLGTVFHAVMQDLYSEKEEYSLSEIRKIRKDTHRIEASLDKHIAEQLHSDTISGRTLIDKHLILQYVDKALETDEALLEVKGEKLHILGLEKSVYGTLNGFKFIGKIDRMDSFTAGTVRIVDYKTGKVNDKEKAMQISESTISSIFSKTTQNKNRPLISLQMLIYDLLIRNSDKQEIKRHCDGKILENVIYQPSSLFVNKEPMCCNIDDDTLASFQKELNLCLDEIKDTAGYWEKTDDVRNTCAYCDFRTICGK